MVESELGLPLGGVVGFWGTHSRVAERTRLILESEYSGKR